MGPSVKSLEVFVKNNFVLGNRNELALEERDLMVFHFVVFQMRMPSFLFRLQTCVFCLKLPHGLYYLFANSKGSSKTALMRRLAWTFAGCMWHTLFSCAGSYFDFHSSSSHYVSTGISQFQVISYKSRSLWPNFAKIDTWSSLHGGTCISASTGLSLLKFRQYIYFTTIGDLTQNIWKSFFTWHFTQKK